MLQNEKCHRHNTAQALKCRIIKATLRLCTTTTVCHCNNGYTNAPQRYVYMHIASLGGFNVIIS